MRTIVLGDLHLEDKDLGYLNDQESSIKEFICEQSPDTLILLGDIFHKRKPTPSEILAFDRIIQISKNVCKDIHLLRGNHDTETKAENSPTILSIYAEYFKVFVHSKPTVLGNWGFIPHYEDELIIKKYLQAYKKCDFVFAHCGFRGCFNSLGDNDFNLSLDDFYTTTILGHIHNYKEESAGKIIALGTPYSTSFREANKDSFYGVIDDGKLSIKEAVFGPVFLKVNKYNYKNLLDSYKERYILLQFEVDRYDINFDELDCIKKEYPSIGHLELKFEPIFNEEALSSFSSKESLFRINEAIIDQFLDEANTTIPKKELKDYLKRLSNEYQES